MSQKVYSQEEILTLFEKALWDIDRKKLPKVDFTTRFSDLGLDSVQMFEVIGNLEEKLSVLFPDDKLSEINTLHDLHVLLNTLPKVR